MSIRRIAFFWDAPRGFISPVLYTLSCIHVLGQCAVVGASRYPSIEWGGPFFLFYENCVFG
jgi:hypothetical protein